MPWGAGAPEGSNPVGNENPRREVSLPQSRCRHAPRDELGWPLAQWPLIRAGVESFRSPRSPAPRQLTQGSLLTKSCPLSTALLSPLLAQAVPAWQSHPPPLLLINLKEKCKLTRERHMAKPKPCCSPCSCPLKKHKARQKKSAAIAHSHAVQPPPSFAVANTIPIKKLFLATPTAL